jgi:hypothetical protein
MNINDDGYSKEIMRLFRQFKLGNSLHRCKYVVSNQTPEILYMAGIEIDRIIEREMADSLADQILVHNGSAIKKTFSLDDCSTTYDLKLIVVKLEDFKTIVEAAIQMLSPDQIKRIRDE